jgi:hypothetical protein
MNRQKEHILLATIMLIAGGVRIFHLGYFSMWFDEAASWHLARLPIAKIVELAKIDNTPPLYHILLHYWLKIIPDNDFWIKIPAMLFGLIAVFLTYRLGKELFSPQVGILASLITALSFNQVHYSQENRMYSLQVLLALCSTLCLVQSLRTDKLSYWSGWLIANILLFYNHLFGLFLFIAQGMYVVIDGKIMKGKWWKWGIANIILFIACSFWFPVIFSQMRAIQSDYWVNPISVKQLIVTAVSLLGGTDLGNKFWLAGFLNLAFLLPASVGTWILIRDGKRGDLILPILFFTPLIIVFIISLSGKSLFFGRYFVFLVPFLHIIMAQGILKVLGKWWKKITLIYLVIASMVFLYGYYTVSEYSELQKRPTRQLTERLRELALPGEIVIHQGIDKEGLEPYFVSLRYNRGRYREFLWRNEPLPFYFGKQIFREESRLTDFSRLAGEKRIWVVFLHSGDNYNQYGLPTSPPAKRLASGESYRLNVDELWEQLFVLGFRPDFREWFQNVALIEFVK